MSRARATNGAPTSSPRVCPRVARARRARRLVSSSSRASSSSFFGFPVPPVLDPAVAISSVAEAALKTPLVLKSYGSVRVVIDAPIEAAIARGEVRRVEITGTAWSSPRSLTCRNIEFIVDEPCALDVEAAVGMRGILLKRPARGSARLTFDSSDFGNFLSHPLLRAAAAAARRDEGGFDFVFEGGETARVCGDEGYLEYSGVVGGSGERRTIRMRPMEGSRVDAHLVGADADETFERSMASFFERLVIDLEGTELRYRDMTIDPARSTVDFELDLCVRKFPSPNIQF